MVHLMSETAAGAAAVPDDGRAPLTERFERLATLDQQDDGQRVETFSQVLADLQRELDDASR